MLPVMSTLSLARTSWEQRPALVSSLAVWPSLEWHQLMMMAVGWPALM